MNFNSSFIQPWWSFQQSVSTGETGRTSAKTTIFLKKKNMQGHILERNKNTESNVWLRQYSLLALCPLGLLLGSVSQQDGTWQHGHGSTWEIYPECWRISHLYRYKIFWLRKLSLNELCWVSSFRYYTKEGVLPVNTDFCKYPSKFSGRLTTFHSFVWRMCLPDTQHSWEA